jgi:4-hydroxybenzoate polyprenyltransferase
MIYDTIYAHQDIEDDIKVGVRSMAVSYKSIIRQLLWGLWVALSATLVCCGRLSGFGPAYYVVCVGGAVVSLGCMVGRVELKSSSNCWWWFKHGSCVAGASIATGLLIEYSLRRRVAHGA